MPDPNTPAPPSANAPGPGATGTYQPAPIDGPGTQAGPYRLVRPLGEGGMGVVWLAEQTEPVRRMVALKLIKPGMDSAQVLARFEAERQALALMDHTNIARVLDAGATADGRPYFVMELVKGVPITRYCDEARLTPRERLELFVPVCQAVQHAHQKGVIHRDLKPSNVLVALADGRPAPKVIDFGVAKATQQKLTERTLFTGVGQVVGTLEYMAPEQAEPNNLDIDTRADVYSLGVVLYELLAGSPPFTSRQLRGAAYSEVMRLIREVEPPKPSTRLSGSEELPGIAARRNLEPRRLTRLVHGDLDWIVMKCLEKERGRRYETANGLAMDLQRYLADEPVTAGPPSAVYRLRKFLRRNKGPTVAAGLLVLALIGGVAGTTWGLVEARRAAERARAGEQEARAERDAKETALVAEAARHREAVEQRNRAVRAERETREQAAIALAVNDFLQKDLLGQAAIGNQPAGGPAGRNPNVTVRELLDRAAKAVEGQFRDQPRTEAAVRLTLGDTYRALGRPAEARPHLERSVERFTVALGADHPDTLSARNSLALLESHQGRYDRAEPALREVLRAREARQGAGHPDTLAVKNNLAALYQNQGFYDRAEPLYLEALRALTEQKGPDHTDTLACKNNLAELYREQALYDRAEPLYREVLRSHAERLGADHPTTLIGKNNLALLLQERGEYDRAEPLYREVLQTQTEKLGADHPDTLNTRHNLAALDHARGRYDRAEPAYREVLQARTAKLGPDHPDTLTTKHNLASVLLDQGKYDQAEPLFREVVQARAAVLGADHPDTLAAKNGLAGLYQARKQYDRAEALYGEVVQASTARLGADHPDTLIAKNNLAVVYRVRGELDRAEPLLLEVLQARAAKLGADHPLTLQSKNNLASLYHARKDYDRAEALFREALQALTDRLGADHPSTLNTRDNLGNVYLARGEYARAEPLYREALDGLRRTLGPTHPKTQSVLGNLADCYGRLRQPAKAEPLLREEAALARDRDGPESPAYAGRLAALGVNLIEQERWADAETVLRECLAVREKTQPAAWGTFNARSLLGDCLLGQKRYADAEPLLLLGYEGMKLRADQIPPAVRPDRLAEALGRLVRLSEATGQQEKAERWRKERDALPRPAAWF
jgi:serine/threonine protein kinase/lipopolysaccharide biosynthesis regulator YciM